MATPTILAATPVITARQWTTALAPRDGGGWKFITQSYNYPNDLPSEWVLIDIEEGTVTLQQGIDAVFSNSNFQVPSANTGIVTNNQLRAQNGRIFFPETFDLFGAADAVYVAYYDPGDEAIHELPAVVDPTGDHHSIAYSAVFDHDGDLIYMGTQAAAADIPMVFSVDPVTLATEVICNVGTATPGQPRYAYYLAKDAGPGADFLYAAVGQDGWELVSVDVTTGTPTILLTTVGPGMQFIELETRAEGFTANVISNGVQTRYWLADGAISAYPGSGAPPGGARAVAAYSNPLVTPPEIDWSRGIGFLLWRPNGSTGDWTEITYEVDYIGPIELESLAAQSNGTLIGNSVQYNGFWNYQKASQTSTWFGNWPSGVSSTTLCVLSNSTVYIAGYPSGALFLWNPLEAWAPDGTADGNPAPLGSFGTEVRYPYFLIHCELNNRLYTAGRQERDSLGSGVGFYDIDADTFTTEDDDLDELIPRGLVVLEDEGLMVYSGQLLPGAIAPEAQIVVYDLDLVELNRWTVEAGLQSTGLLCTTPDPNVVVGLSPDLLYRIDVTTGDVLASVPLSATTIGGYAKRNADGSLWVEIDQDLVRIDVTTLDMQTIVDLEISTSYFAWLGSDLYMTSGSELRYLPGEGNMANLFQAIPAPAGNGSGAAVDFSAFGPDKTIVVTAPSGGWPIDPTITIEVNNDAVPNGTWAPLKTFKGGGVVQVQCACLWMRATVQNYQGGGAPIINVGGTDEGVIAVDIVATDVDGVSPAVDISGLELFKTVWIGEVFSGAVNIEISCDAAGLYWATIQSITKAGQYAMFMAANWMRARRSGVVRNAGTTPLIAVAGAPT